MTELRKFQMELLETAKEFDQALKKCKIPYFLIGGSVLGAVRHEGFIPWDDDMDIGLYRKDFEKMEEIIEDYLPKHLMYCPVGRTEYDKTPIGRLYNISDKTKSLENCPLIDIFAIDNVPNSKLLRRIQQVVSNVYHLSIYRDVPQNRGKFASNFTKVILKITPNFIFNLLQKLSKKVVIYWQYKDTKDLSNIFGTKHYFKEIMPFSNMGNPVLKEFEGYLFPLPEDWDSYLTHLYGDYMKLPPKEQQVPSHRDQFNKEEK